MPTLKPLIRRVSKLTNADREVPRAAIRLLQYAYLLLLNALHERALVALKVKTDASDEIFVIDRLRAEVPGLITPQIRQLVDHAGRMLRESVDERLRRIARIPPALLEHVGTLQVEQFRERNAHLIVTIGEEYLDALAARLGGPGAGLHIKGAADTIQEAFDVTRSRAEFWARDQTLKLHADINEARQTAVGVKHYIWRGCLDGKEREEHLALEGTEQSWDDPPDTGDGETNHPGQDYNCRCNAEPVPPDETDETA